MFDTVDVLDDAIQKMLADGPCGDVERMSRLAEQVEFLKLREVREYDRSCAWKAEGFVSTAAALRSKCRMVHGTARSAVSLGRKLETLPETAAAFGAGEISRHHASVIAAAYTPERATMIEGIEAELVAAARLTHPERLRNALKQSTDAFDGDGGATSDAAEHELNKVTLSATLGGRGILNGSLDAELSRLATAALNAEMEALRRIGETRHLPERRAEAFEAMCRRSLDHHDDGTRRRRGQPHVIVVQDVAELAGTHPELVADIRRETSEFGRLTRTTLQRLSCDAKICRVITDGPSQILDVGRTTRNVSTPIWNALVIRDRHCTEPGCERPPGECEAHHIWHWEHGGPTNLGNLRLLCWHHHKQQHIHDAIQRK